MTGTIPLIRASYGSDGCVDGKRRRALPAAPLIAHLPLSLSTVGPLGRHWASHRHLPVVRPSALLGVLRVAAIYLLVDPKWSPSSAYAAALSLSALVLVLSVVSNAIWQLQGDPLRALAIALYVGVFIGGVFLCFEVQSEQRLQQLRMHFFHGMRPKEADVLTGAGDGAKSIASDEPEHRVTGAATAFAGIVVVP